MENTSTIVDNRGKNMKTTRPDQTCVPQFLNGADQKKTVPAIRIMFINSAANIFGAERCLLTILDHLDHSRFHPVVLLPHSGSLQEELEKRGVKTILYDYKFRPLKNSLRRFWDLTRFMTQLIRNERISIVHINLHYYASNFWLAFFLTKVTVVSHVRSPLWFHPFEKFVMSRHHKILFVSKAVRQKFVQKRRSDALIRFRPEQLEVLYDGHDLQKFQLPKRDILRKEFKLDPQDRIICLIGAIDSVKGQDVLIEAAGIVNRTYPNARYFIIGSQYKHSPEKQAYALRLRIMVDELGLKGKVFFTGYRDDVPEILPEIDILVQPSSHEALGGSMLEAMCAAKPVIGFQIDAAMEVIGEEEAGIVLKERTGKSLAQALIFLLENPKEARHRGLAGQSRARRFFDIKNSNERLMQIYTQAVSKRSERP